MRAARAAAVRGDANGDAFFEREFEYYARPRPRPSSSQNRHSSRSGVMRLSPERCSSASRRQATQVPKYKQVPRGSAPKRPRVAMRLATARGKQKLHQGDADSRFPIPYPGVDSDRREVRTLPVASMRQHQDYHDRHHHHARGRRPLKRAEDGHRGYRKELRFEDHGQGVVAASAGRRRRTRPRSAIVTPLSRRGAASDYVNGKESGKAKPLASKGRRKHVYSNAPAVEERSRQGGKRSRPSSAPLVRGGHPDRPPSAPSARDRHDHQERTRSKSSDGGMLVALSRLGRGSDCAPRELRIMKWVVLRETYLTKLHGVVSAYGKRARSKATTNGNDRASKSPNDHKRRSPKLFALLTELLTVLRRITVEIVEAVERWRRGDKERPFIWGSSNYLVKAAGDIEFLSRLPGLEEHLGVLVSNNPFLSQIGLDGRSAVLDRSSIRSRSGKFPLSASGSLGVSAERVAAASAMLYREVRRTQRRQRWEQEENRGTRLRSGDPTPISSPSGRRRRPVSSCGKRSPADSGQDRFDDNRIASRYGDIPKRCPPSSNPAAAAEPSTSTPSGGSRISDRRRGVEYREKRHYENQPASKEEEEEREGKEEEEERQKIHNACVDDNRRRVSQAIPHRSSTARKLSEAESGSKHSRGLPRISLPSNRGAVDVVPRHAPRSTDEHHLPDGVTPYRNERRATEVPRVRDNPGDGFQRRVRSQHDRRRSTGSSESGHAQGAAARGYYTTGTEDEREESSALPPDDQSLDYQNGGVMYADDNRYEQQDEGYEYREDDQNLDYYYEEERYHGYAEDEGQQGYETCDVPVVDEGCTTADGYPAANVDMSDGHRVDDPGRYPDDTAGGAILAQPPDDAPVEQPSETHYQQFSSESAAEAAAAATTRTATIAEAAEAVEAAEAAEAEAVVQSTQALSTEETKSSDDPDPQDGAHGRMGRRGSPFNLIFNMCDGMLTDLKDLGGNGRTYGAEDESYDFQPSTPGGVQEASGHNNEELLTAATHGWEVHQEEEAARTTAAREQHVPGQETERGRPPPVLRGAVYASLTRNIAATRKGEGPESERGASGSDQVNVETSNRTLADYFLAWAERTEGRLRHRDAKAAKHYRLGRLRHGMSAWERHRATFLGGRMAEAFAGRFGMSSRMFVRFAFEALRAHAKGARIVTRNRSAMGKLVFHLERFGRARLRQAWRRWVLPKMGQEHWRPEHAEALRQLYRHWSMGRQRGALETWRRHELRQHGLGAEPSRSPIRTAGSFASLKGKLKAAGSFANLKAAPTSNASKSTGLAPPPKGVRQPETSATASASGKDEDSWAEWLSNEASVSVVSPDGDRRSPIKVTASSTTNNNKTVNGSSALSPTRSFRGLGTAIKSMKSFRDGRDKSQTQQQRLRPTASFGSPALAPSSSPPPPSTPDPAAANAAMGAIDALQARHFADKRTKLRGEASKRRSRENAAATIQRALWRAPRERRIAARASNSASLIQRMWRLQSRRWRAGCRLVRAWRARVRVRVATLDRALVEAASEGDLRAVAFLLHPPAATVTKGSWVRLGGAADVNAVAGDDSETALHAAAAGGTGWSGEDHRHAPTTGVEDRVRDGAGATVGQRGSSTLAPMAPAGKSGTNLAGNLSDADGQRNGSGHWLRRRGHAPNWAGVIQALVEAGAAVEARDRRGFTPMMTAGEKGSRETVAALANIGAEVDAKEVRGGKRTPLVIAAQKANASAAAALLEYGARVNLAVGDGLTPLHEAVGAGSIDVAEMLVRAGANVNATNESAGMTPLHLAVANDQHAAARLLVHSGADVCLPDARGLTCLRLTIEMADAPTVALLLAAEPPADLSVKDENGGTVLHAACRLGLTDIARLLLEHGADPHVRDARGRTPELVALNLDHGDCAGLFYNVDIHSYIPNDGGGAGDSGGVGGDDSSKENAPRDGEARGEDSHRKENRHGERGIGGSNSDDDSGTDKAQRPAEGAAGQEEEEEEEEEEQWDRDTAYQEREETEGEGAWATDNLREGFAEAVVAARRASSLSMPAQDQAEVEGSSYIGEYAEGALHTEISKSYESKSWHEGNGRGGVDAKEEGPEWIWSEVEGWIRGGGSGSGDPDAFRSQPPAALNEENRGPGATEAAAVADDLYTELRQSADWQQSFDYSSYGATSGGSKSNNPGYRNSWAEYERDRGTELDRQEGAEEGGDYGGGGFFAATIDAESASPGIEEGQERGANKRFHPNADDINYVAAGDDVVGLDDEDGDKSGDGTSRSLEGSLEGTAASTRISNGDANHRPSIAFGTIVEAAKARNRWTPQVDEVSGSVYYLNEESGLTQWDVPEDAVVVAAEEG
ncbi:unnamed protein product [Ectocarpus sp. 4 AP-2014]